MDCSAEVLGGCTQANPLQTGILLRDAEADWMSLIDVLCVRLGTRQGTFYEDRVPHDPQAPTTLPPFLSSYFKFRGEVFLKGIGLYDC